MLQAVAMLSGPIFALILILAERRIGAPQTDWRINLQSWLLRIVGAFTVYGAVQAWSGPALIDGAELPIWAAVLIYVLVYDLAEYLFHRMQHRIPVLWAMHSLHHSDPNMSVLTTNRHFWADPLFKSITVLSAAALIISPTPTALAVYGAIGLWNFVTHSQLPINLGRWSWVINTPAYHRRHHSALPEHYDSNFAAILPIWDVLFGDYHRPDGFPPTGYTTRPTGLREQLLWPLYHRRVDAARAE
ncbi:MAG: sterol desaturase family protein [Sphingomonadales bacterium]|nr:sterol desaturase family protein [Sphingomonadales bacterium]